MLRRPEFTHAIARPDHRVCGMMADGPARAALLQRLELCSDATLAKLRGVSTPEVVVLLHEAATIEELPWVDRATYLARVEDAPGLLLPTTAHLDLPADAVLAALLREHPGLKVPLVLWPARRQVVPLGEALPLRRASLRAALEQR